MLVAPGPTSFGAKPRLVVSNHQSADPFMPCGVPGWRPSFSRRTAPASGPVRRRIGTRGCFSCRLAVPRAHSLLNRQDVLPLRATLPSGTLSELSFRPNSVLRPKPGFPCALSGHIELTDNHAPLTASAVRQACSEELARCVFRRCCGHRSHPDQVELSCSLSGCYTWRRRSFLPFRQTEAAPVCRVVQAKNAGVIHRG